MDQTQPTELDELRALTSQLEESVRGLKRVMAEDSEQAERNQNNPDSILDVLETDA